TAAGTAKTKLTTTTLSVVKHSPGGTIFRPEVGPFYTPISKTLPAGNTSRGTGSVSNDHGRQVRGPCIIGASKRFRSA
ncbi:MAG: hypothetical protein ABGZ35_10355, partial [Planctomycetaceae bacterium]